MKNKYIYILALLSIVTLIGCENEGEDSNGGHHQGRMCSECHSSGEHSFTSGVTIFTVLHAKNTDSASYAKNYTIQLGDSEVYSQGRGEGNAHLFHNDLQKFTAKVIDSNGNIVNSSATNSHDSTRLDCNRCHTQSGSNGAPGRIVNKRL